MPKRSRPRLFGACFMNQVQSKGLLCFGRGCGGALVNISEPFIRRPVGTSLLMAGVLLVIMGATGLGTGQTGDHPYIFKLTGEYILPFHDIALAANMLSQSGIAYTRQVTGIPLTAGGTASVNVEPLASHRLDGRKGVGIRTVETNNRGRRQRRVERPAAPSARRGFGAAGLPSGWPAAGVPVARRRYWEPQPTRQSGRSWYWIQGHRHIVQRIF